MITVYCSAARPQFVVRLGTNIDGLDAIGDLGRLSRDDFLQCRPDDALVPIWTSLVGSAARP